MINLIYSLLVGVGNVVLVWLLEVQFDESCFKFLKMVPALLDLCPLTVGCHGISGARARARDGRCSRLLINTIYSIKRGVKKGGEVKKEEEKVWKET